MEKIVNVNSKQEVKEAISTMGSYNGFQGEIRYKNRYVMVKRYPLGKIKMQISYFEDGKEGAVERISNCSSVSGAVSKIAKFLDFGGEKTAAETETDENVVNEYAVEYGLTAKSNEFDREKITCSQDSARYARKFYGDDLLAYESSFIILLDASNRVKGWAKISQGGVLATGVDIKLVAMYAVKSLAASVIFVHNHPSGNNTPSTCDKQLTEKMRKGLQLLGVKLLDSIILTEYCHYSMCDEMEPCIIR